MRTHFITVVYILFFISTLRAQQPALTFSIHLISSTASITCLSPNVNFIASTAHSGNVNYLWVGQNSVLYGSDVSITQPGIYTVSATSPGLIGSSQLISVGINTTAPVSYVSPASQSISCFNSIPAQVNASGSNSPGLKHYFISSYGTTSYKDGPNASFKPGAPGTYTHMLVNAENGCMTSKTFTVAGSGFPTFNLSSANGYTLGCATMSVLSLSINNGSSSLPPGSPVSYTLISPQSGAVSSGILSSQINYSLSSPAEYTVIVRDNSSQCETALPLSITQNTAGPKLAIIVPRNLLNCDVSTVQIKATSNENSVDYKWTWSGSTGFFNGNNLTVTTNSAVSQSTLVNTFTLVAMRNENKCSTDTVISVYQNLFKPQAVIAAATNMLSCLTPSIILTNQSTTGIPPGVFSANLPVVVETWLSPAPQTTTSATSHTALYSGYYTLQVKDLNNSCKASAVIPIFDGKIYPSVNYPVGPAPFCINASVTAVPVYALVNTSQNSSYIYQWNGPVAGITGAINTPTVYANALGIYTVVVTNTLSGCSSIGNVLVASCITGLKDQTIFNQHSIYPNPSANLFHLEFENFNEDVQIKIYNSAGMLVRELSCDTNTSEIDLSSESDGIYILHLLKNNSPIGVSKLVKQSQ